MATVYKDTSVFNGVAQRSFYVDYLENSKATTIKANVNDITFIITNEYQYRPDKLSYKLYGTSDLWWIFSLRNPDLLLDPIYDFVDGLEIKAPTSERAFGLLGRK